MIEYYKENINLGKNNQKKFCSRYGLFLRIISFALAFAFLIEEFGFAEVKSLFEPKDVVVASDIGMIRKAMAGKNQDIIINIQDAHSKLGAQESIAKILDGLVKNYHLNLIALEGASDVVDTALLSSYPVEEVKRKTGEYLLKEGKISAAEFYSAMTKEPVKLYGVDDPELYKENVEVFKVLIEKKKDIRKELKGLKKAVTELEEKIYSPELLGLVRHRLFQKNGDVKFVEYWEYFSKAAASKGLDYSKYPNLSKLSQASALEKEIDFTKAGEDRNAIINELTGKLSGAELEKLILKSLEYKRNKISAAFFHNTLIGFATTVGLDLKAYQNLFLYTDYLSLYESVDLIAVFEETENYENDLKELFFRNEDERALSRLSHCVNILTQLLDTTLTSRDYRFYVENESYCEVQNIKQSFESLAGKYGFLEEMVNFDTLESSIPDARKFYELAEKRNALLLENTRKRMKEEGVHVAALVTGGFHSEGISQLMDEDKLSYLIVMPKFDEKSPDRPYIAVLTQKPKEYEEGFKDSDFYVAQPAGFDTRDQARLAETSRSTIQSFVRLNDLGKGAFKTADLLKNFNRSRTGNNLTVGQIESMVPDENSTPTQVDPIYLQATSLSRIKVEVLAQNLATEAFQKNYPVSELERLFRGVVARIADKSRIDASSLSSQDERAIIALASDILSRKRNEMVSGVVSSLLVTSGAPNNFDSRIRVRTPVYQGARMSAVAVISSPYWISGSAIASGRTNIYMIEPVVSVLEEGYTGFRINALMSGKIKDPQKLIEQHHHLQRVARGAGANVMVFRQRDKKPEQHYTANAGALFMAPDGTAIFIPARYSNKPMKQGLAGQIVNKLSSSASQLITPQDKRGAEVEDNEKDLEIMGAKIRRLIPEGLAWEGQADYMLYDTKGGEKIYFGFIGQRSDEEAHKIVAEYLGRKFVPLRLIDGDFYHGDTAVKALHRQVPGKVQRVMYYPGALDRKSRALIQQYVSTEDLIKIGRRDAFRLLANSADIYDAETGRETIIANASPKRPSGIEGWFWMLGEFFFKPAEDIDPKLRGKLELLGLTVVTIPYGESIEVGGGSTQCSSLVATPIENLNALDKAYLDGARLTTGLGVKTQVLRLEPYSLAEFADLRDQKYDWAPLVKNGTGTIELTARELQNWGSQWLPWPLRGFLRVQTPAGWSLTTTISGAENMTRLLQRLVWLGLVDFRHDDVNYPVPARGAWEISISMAPEAKLLEDLVKSQRDTFKKEVVRAFIEEAQEGVDILILVRWPHDTDRANRLRISDHEFKLSREALQTLGGTMLVVPSARGFVTNVLVRLPVFTNGARLVSKNNPTRRTFLDLIAGTGAFVTLSHILSGTGLAQKKSAVVTPQTSLAQILTRAEELQNRLEGLKFKEALSAFRLKIKAEMEKVNTGDEWKKLNQGLSRDDAQAVFVARLALVNRGTFNEDRQKLEEIVDNTQKILDEAKLLGKQLFVVSIDDPDYARTKEITEKVKNLREQAGKAVASIKNTPSHLWTLPTPDEDGLIILVQNGDQVITIKRAAQDIVMQQQFLKVSRVVSKADLTQASNQSPYKIIHRTKTINVDPANRHTLTFSSEDEVAHESASEVYRYSSKGARISSTIRNLLLGLIFTITLILLTTALDVSAQNEKMARALPGANPPRTKPIKGPKVLDAKELIKQTDLFLKEAAEQDLKLGLGGVLTRFSETAVDVAGSLDQAESKEKLFTAWKEFEKTALKPRNIKAELEIKNEKVNPIEKEKIYYFKFTFKSSGSNDDLSKYLSNLQGSFQIYLNGGQGARLAVRLSDPRGDGVIVKVEGARRAGFVGDPQGNADETRAAVFAAGFIDAHGDWSAQEGEVLIIAGDFPDGGPKSREVWLDIQKWRTQAAEKGGAVILLKGNHEEMLEAFFDKDHPKHKISFGGFGGFSGLWYKSGGTGTLRSFMEWPENEPFDYYANTPEGVIREIDRRHPGRGVEFEEMLNQIKMFPYLVDVNETFLGFHAGLPFEGETELEKMLVTAADRETVLWSDQWMNDPKPVLDFMKRSGRTHAAFGHSPVHLVNGNKMQAKIGPLDGMPNIYSLNTLPGKAPEGGAQGVLVVDFDPEMKKVTNVHSVYGSNNFLLESEVFEGEVSAKAKGTGARFAGSNARKIILALSTLVFTATLFALTSVWQPHLVSRGPSSLLVGYNPSPAPTQTQVASVSSGFSEINAVPEKIDSYSDLKKPAGVIQNSKKTDTTVLATGKTSRINTHSRIKISPQALPDASLNSNNPRLIPPSFVDEPMMVRASFSSGAEAPIFIEPLAEPLAQKPVRGIKVSGDKTGLVQTKFVTNVPQISLASILASAQELQVELEGLKFKESLSAFRLKIKAEMEKVNTGDEWKKLNQGLSRDDAQAVFVARLALVNRGTFNEDRQKLEEIVDDTQRILEEAKILGKQLFIVSIDDPDYSRSKEIADKVKNLREQAGKAVAGIRNTPSYLWTLPTPDKDGSIVLVRNDDQVITIKRAAQDIVTQQQFLRIDRFALKSDSDRSSHWVIQRTKSIRMDSNNHHTLISIRENRVTGGSASRFHQEIRIVRTTETSKVTPKFLKFYSMADSSRDLKVADEIAVFITPPGRSGARLSSIGHNAKMIFSAVLLTGILSSVVTYGSLTSWSFMKSDAPSSQIQSAVSVKKETSSNLKAESTFVFEKLNLNAIKKFGENYRNKNFGDITANGKNTVIVNSAPTVRAESRPVNKRQAKPKITRKVLLKTTKQETAVIATVIPETPPVPLENRPLVVVSVIEGIPGGNQMPDIKLPVIPEPIDENVVVSANVADNLQGGNNGLKGDGKTQLITANGNDSSLQGGNEPLQSGEGSIGPNRIVSEIIKDKIVEPDPAAVTPVINLESALDQFDTKQKKDAAEKSDLEDSQKKLSEGRKIIINLFEEDRTGQKGIGLQAGPGVSLPQLQNRNIYNPKAALEKRTEAVKSAAEEAVKAQMNNESRAQIVKSSIEDASASGSAQFLTDAQKIVKDFLPSEEIEGLIGPSVRDLKKIQQDAADTVFEQTGSPVAMGGGGPPPPDKNEIKPEMDTRIITAISNVNSILTYTQGAASFNYSGNKFSHFFRRLVPNQISININSFNGMPLPLVSPIYTAFPKFDAKKQADELEKAVVEVTSVKTIYQAETLDLLSVFKDNETARESIERSIQSALTLGKGADTETRRRAAEFVARYAPLHAVLKANAEKAKFDLKRRGVPEEDLGVALQAEKAALPYIAERHTNRKFDGALLDVKNQAGTIKVFLEGRAKGSQIKKQEALVSTLDRVVKGNPSVASQDTASATVTAVEGLTVPDAPKKASVVIPPTGTFAIFTDRDSITSGSPYAPTIQSGTWTVTYPGFNFTLVAGKKNEALREKARAAVAQASEAESSLFAKKEANETHRRLFFLEGLREKLKLLNEAQATSKDPLILEDISAQIQLTELSINQLSDKVAGGIPTPAVFPKPDQILGGIHAGQALEALAQKKNIKLEPAVSFQQSPGYGYLVVVNPLNAALKWAAGILHPGHKSQAALADVTAKELEKTKQYLAALRQTIHERAQSLQAAQEQFAIKEEQFRIASQGSDAEVSRQIALELVDAKTAFQIALADHDRIMAESAAWHAFFSEREDIPFKSELRSVWKGEVKVEEVSGKTSEQSASSSFQLTTHAISATTFDLLTGLKPIVGNGLGISGSKTFSAGVDAVSASLGEMNVPSTDSERFILHAFDLVQNAGKRLKDILSDDNASTLRFALLGARELGFDEANKAKDVAGTISVISVSDPATVAKAIVDARWEGQLAAKAKIKAPVLESITWNGFWLPAKTSIAPAGVFRQGGIAGTFVFNLSNIFSGGKKIKDFRHAQAAVLKTARDRDYVRTLNQIKRLSEESDELVRQIARSQDRAEKLLNELQTSSGTAQLAVALRFRSELAAYGSFIQTLEKNQAHLSAQLKILENKDGQIAVELRQALGITVKKYKPGESLRIAGTIKGKGARLVAEVNSDPAEKAVDGARLCGISGTVFPVKNSVWLEDGWDGPLPKRMVDADADLRHGMYPLGTDGVGVQFWVIPRGEMDLSATKGYSYSPRQVSVRGTVPQGNFLTPHTALDFHRGSAVKLEEDLQDGLQPVIRQLGREDVVAVKNGNAESSFHVRKTSKGSGQIIDTQPFSDSNVDKSVVISRGRKVNKAELVDGKLEYDTVVHSAGFEANGDLFKVRLLADGQFYDHSLPQLKKLLGVNGNNDVEFMGRMVYLFSSKGIWQDSIFVAYMRNIMMSVDEPMLSGENIAALEAIMKEEFGRLYTEQFNQKAVSDLSEIKSAAFEQAFKDRVRVRILQGGFERLSREQGSDALDRFILETLRAFTQNDPRTAAAEIMNEVADLDISYNMKIEFTDYSPIYLIVRGQPGALVRNTTHPVIRWNSNPALLIENTFRYYYKAGDEIDSFELKGNDSNASGRGGEIVQINPDLTVEVYSLVENRPLTKEEVEGRWKKPNNTYNEVPSFSPAITNATNTEDLVESETRGVGGGYIQVLDKLWEPGSLNSRSEERAQKEVAELADLYEEKLGQDGQQPAGPAFLILISRENTSAGEWYAKLLQQSFNELQHTGQVVVMDSHDYFLRVARGWPVTNKNTKIIVLDDAYATIHSMGILFKAGQPNEEEAEEFKKFADELAKNSQTPATIAHVVKSKLKQAGTVYLFSDKIRSNGAEALGQEFGLDSPFTAQIFTTGFKSGISVSPGGLGALVLNLQEFHLRLLEGLREQFGENRQPLGLTFSTRDIHNLREAFDHFKYKTLPNIVGQGQEASDIYEQIMAAADNELSPYFLETAKVEILKAIHLWGLIGFGVTETAIFSLLLTYHKVSLPLIYAAILTVLLQLVTAARYQASGFIFYSLLRLTDQRWKAAKVIFNKVFKKGVLPTSQDLKALGRRRSLMDRLSGRTIAFLNPDWHFSQWLSWTHRLGLTGVSTEVAAQHADGLIAIEPESQLIRRGTMIFMSLGSFVGQAAASPFISYLRTATGKGVDLAKAIVSWAGAGAFIVGIGPDKLEAVKNLGFHAWISTHDPELEKLLVRPYDDSLNGPIAAHDLINSPMSLIAEAVLHWAIERHIYGLSYFGINRSSSALQPLASAKVTTPSPLPRPPQYGFHDWRQAFDHLGKVGADGARSNTVEVRADGARIATAISTDIRSEKNKTRSAIEGPADLHLRESGARLLAASPSNISYTATALPVGIILGANETEAQVKEIFADRFGEATERFKLIFSSPGPAPASAFTALQNENVRFILDSSSLSNSEAKFQLLTALAKLDADEFNLLFVAISGLTQSSVKRLSRSQKILVLQAIQSVLAKPAPQEIIQGLFGLTLKPEVILPGTSADGTAQLARNIDQIIAQALIRGNLSEALSFSARKIATYLDPNTSLDGDTKIGMETESLLLQFGKQARTRFALTDPSLNADLTAVEKAAANGLQSSMVIDLEVFLKDGQGVPFVNRMERLNAKTKGAVNFALLVRDTSIQNAADLISRYPEAAVFGNNILFAPGAQTTADIALAKDEPTIILMPKQGLLTVARTAEGKTPLVAALDDAAATTTFFLEISAQLIALSGDVLSISLPGGAKLRKINGVYVFLPPVAPMDYQELLRAVEGARFAQTSA